MNTPQPLKILILNYEYPPLGGGAGVISKKLAEEFCAQGHTVTVLTTWFKGNKELEVIGNLKIIRLKSYRKRTDRSNPYEMYAWMIKAVRYCRNNVNAGDFDICQANFTLPGGPVGYYLKRKYKLPFIILSHGHDIPWYFPKQMFFLHLLFYFPIKFVCLQSDRNILLTYDMKQIADAFLGPKHASKNIIIHNGMDLSEIDWTLKHETLNVIFVGRMVEQKDPLRFLEAVKLLNEKGVEAHYEMYGDGALMDKVVSKIEEYKLTNVELMGKVDNAVVLKAMKKAHVMIQPSLHEAMSVSVLEAISSGVYVITTPVSGNKQIIIDGLNGKLVPHNDINAIVEEVERLLQSDINSKQSKEALLHYEDLNEKFGWKSVLSRYNRTFKEILG